MMALLLSSLTVKTNNNEKMVVIRTKNVVATVFVYSLFSYFFIGAFRDKMTLRE